MKGTTLGLMLVLTGIPVPDSGDLYKYTDADGRVYFTNAPLKGSNFRLKWRRTLKKLIQAIRKSSKRPLVLRSLPVCDSAEEAHGQA